MARKTRTETPARVSGTAARRRSRNLGIGSGLRYRAEVDVLRGRRLHTSEPLAWYARTAPDQYATITG
nr:hypothetical protein GCM10020063_056020 [Dactylosporangium thailandense]